MGGLTIRKFAKIAFLAALLGSTTGTIVYFVDHFFGHPNTHPRPTLFDLMFFIPFWVMSFAGTIPGSLFIGAPVVFPFRKIIARHPIWTFVPTISIGLLVSFGVLGWAFKEPLGGNYQDLEILFSYAGSTAFGFVCALGCWGHRHGVEL